MRVEGLVGAIGELVKAWAPMTREAKMERVNFMMDLFVVKRNVVWETRDEGQFEGAKKQLRGPKITLTIYIVIS